MVNEKEEEGVKEDISVKLAEMDPFVEEDEEGTAEDLKEDSIPESEEEKEELSPNEAAAAADGHVAKDVWEEQGKDPKDWVDANIFLMRGQLFGKIREQNRQISEGKKSLQVMTVLYKTAEEVGAKNAVEKLKQQKIVAMEDGDYKKAVEIDEQLSEVKKPSKIDELTTPSSSELNERIKEQYQEWIPKNSWYMKDKVLRAYADTVAGTYIAEYGNELSTVKLFNHVVSVVKQDNPDKFENSNRQRRSKVGTTGRTTSNISSNTSKGSVRDLDEEERRVGTNLVRDGAFKNLQAFAEAHHASALIRGKHPKGASTAIFE